MKMYSFPLLTSKGVVNLRCQGFFVQESRAVPFIVKETINIHFGFWLMSKMKWSNKGGLFLDYTIEFMRYYYCVDFREQWLDHIVEYKFIIET